MTNKERYSNWCIREKGIPVFSQPWWMDAMCGPDNWDVYLVGEGNDIKASFVYYIKQTSDGKMISRALLTQNNGIYIHYPEGQGIIAKQKYEEKIINEIIDYVEMLGLTSYDQQYNWRFNNWLPFFWNYYKETTKYTYVIDDTSDMESIRMNYSADARNMIRKARLHVKVDECISIDDFYYINKMSFDRQNIEIPYSLSQFKTLYYACKEHNAVKLLQAVDNDGNIHSVAMLVWDYDTVYFLLNGTNPEYKKYQSNYLLIDECIREASQLNKSFDFEGSVIRNVNHAFREFGGIPKAYFRIHKIF